MLIDLCGQNGAIKLTDKVIGFELLLHIPIIVLREFIMMCLAKFHIVFIEAFTQVDIKSLIFVHGFLDVINNDIQ